MRVPEFKCDLNAVLMWYHLANITYDHIPRKIVVYEIRKSFPPATFQQPCHLTSTLAISHVQPNHTSVMPSSTLLLKQSSLLTPYYVTRATNCRQSLLYCGFSVTFWIRVVKQLLVSQVASKSAVERSTCMDKTRVYFFCFSFLFPLKRFPVAVYLFVVVKQILTNLL